MYRGVLVIFHMQNIIPPVPNTISLKVAVHFDICILQHPTKFEAEVKRRKKSYANDPKNFWQVSENWRKVTKSAMKHFEKFQLFVVGCIFALFQCCTPKSSIGSDFGVKPKKSLFFKLPFLLQCCFSPTLKQWHVTWYSPWKHLRPGIVIAKKLKWRREIFLYIIKNVPKKARNKAKNRIFSEISSADITCC